MKDWSLLRGIVACGLLVVVVWFSEWIHTPTNVALAASETKDAKRYGNCLVSTSINLLTDEETHNFGCEDQKKSTLIVISQYPNQGLTLNLKSGQQSWPLDTTNVSLRFYPDPIIERPATQWINAIGYAQIKDQQFISSLFPQITNEGRLVVEVGFNSGVIDLTGAAQAVQDFQQRIGNHQ